MRYLVELHYDKIASFPAVVSEDKLARYVAAAMSLKSWTELLITRQWEDENE